MPYDEALPLQEAPECPKAPVVHVLGMVTKPRDVQAAKHSLDAKDRLIGYAEQQVTRSDVLKRFDGPLRLRQVLEDFQTQDEIECTRPEGRVCDVGDASDHGGADLGGSLDDTSFMVDPIYS